MIRLISTLLNTVIEDIPEDKYKEAFCKAVEVKGWIRNQNAYAIAANQLGIPFRFFVVGKYKRWGLPTDIFFNPVYLPENPDEKRVSKERCLSYPGREFLVQRYPKVHIKFYDPREKKWAEGFLDGISAIIAQHETDHLNGKTDEQSQNEFMEYMRQQQELEKNAKLVPVDENKEKIV